ncbi:uncharacterized protein LOC132935386 [Metopolophium dirhodum]|uniref:uncharacterized protein LOC132935386 n=1 Tax=Metopolophium dirhodum TaxID=44670 RepID=UPI00298F84B2|nr:uncharacterized protein LOC132935386 [Metopolophium dirhodum]
MGLPVIVSKSVFDIRPFGKKSVTVGLLISKQISIIVLLEYFCRLKQLQHCVDLYIAEKQKRLPSFQTTFDAAYELIKNDVRGLPISCQRNEFTNQYIQNYDFSYYSHLQNDDTSFLYEILQFHFNVMSDMILQDLIV